ncbi:MAG: hypothetical protein ACD_57C00265G0002 [uncultured bacterium]|uniref:Putative pre-16S rRNA nuclease n=1 Tax=Candidatus Woesebacteria bacterium RIFCSPLOWO2_01_FULL_39_21 TaxID=1802519 RepID=A0A1F8BHF5_9BACT|nr:MAG: hypothetical protein ACD_57C00265G0002 [uncultured bacterium]OGM22768.1 MAG: hypothetical protein A2691_02735 [Candidatus Woesebacteria bacterium RIFCSPHIGHO2_01_FULL_39_23]OGM63462.1 MAG: hypothetical protein A2961_03285 [Candidatus Woesebacteria bacterium RIFCSPLOWO2_01_FULL_39_21]
MKLLGVDFGRKKIGIAFSETKIAKPLVVLKGGDLLKKTVKIIEEYWPELIVVGVSEGKSGEFAKEFARKLEKAVQIKTVLEDETLSTYEAQTLSRVQNIKRSRRQKMEDAFAATLVLQSFLDRHV